MLQHRLTKRILAYFVRGLVLVAPLYITFMIILRGIQYLDGILPIYIKKTGQNPLYLPGLGLLIILAGIVLLGFIFSRYIPKSFSGFVETLLKKTPLIGLIYYSIKDLISAFVGDKKKFNQPVLMTLNYESGIKKLGFLTQNDVDYLAIKDHVAVYCPHSYAFSGELFIVPSQNITLLDMPSADVMKMIVSGGVSKK
jgi:uncharacterized membrane protein